MKIVCISDLHSQLTFSVPEADLLLIAGDLCPAFHSSSLSVQMQRDWLDSLFRFWFLEQPIKEAVIVAGNHDWIWEISKKQVPEMNENFHYIEDESIEILGKKIYGTPVQLPFLNWAFNRSESSIQKYWNNIPENLDILLLHSPPYGILDKTHHSKFASEHIGSKSLKKKIDEVRPKLVVFGHNHGEQGIVEKDGITYVNASLVDERYNLTREPIVLEI